MTTTTTQPLTIIHRITNAVTKIGTSNGTQIPEANYEGEDKSNSARDTWITKRLATCEYLIASTIKKVAEKRETNAKEKLKGAFAATLSRLKIGDKVMEGFGNVGIMLELRNGQRRINREQVITVLTTEYKWKMEDITQFLNKIEKQSEPSLYLTPSATI